MMKAEDENATSALDRLNATLSWRGLPAVTGDAQIDVAMTCFEAFAGNIQKLCSESRGVDVGPLRDANDRLARSIQEFLHCRQPQDLIAAKAKVLAAMLEAASAQAELRGDLTLRIQNCYAVTALSSVDQSGNRTKIGAPFDRSNEHA